MTLQKKQKPKSLEEFLEMMMKNPDAIHDMDLWVGHAMYWKGLPFPSDNLNFLLQLHLSAQVHGGPSTGEIFYAVSKMDVNNLKTWEKEFIAMAQRVEARAKQCEQKGHHVSARQAYLRATFHYRAPLWLMNPAREVEKFKGYLKKSQDCFRKAGALFDPPIEYHQIPFEGKSLPLYFQKANSLNKPCPTVIMLNGGECNAEDGYFVIAPACKERGYNFVAVDLPGQGGLPFEGLPHRPDSEKPMGAVLDYLTERDDVDPERIATYGVSMGGYLGPRAAVHDRRIKAVIANSIIDDIYGLWKELEIFFTERLKKIDESMWGGLEMLAWRWGLESPLDLIDNNKPFTYDPKEIQCPVLIVVGEGEYNSSSYIQKVQKRCLEAINNDNKKMIITPLNEGAAHHCLPDNLPLACQVAFDWLDELW